MPCLAQNHFPTTLTAYQRSLSLCPFPTASGDKPSYRTLQSPEASPGEFLHKTEDAPVAQQATASKQPSCAQEALVHRRHRSQYVLQNRASNQRVLDGCREGWDRGTVNNCSSTLRTGPWLVPFPLSFRSCFH